MTLHAVLMSWQCWHLSIIATNECYLLQLCHLRAAIMYQDPPLLESFLLMARRGVASSPPALLHGRGRAHLPWT